MLPSTFALRSALLSRARELRLTKIYFAHLIEPSCRLRSATLYDLLQKIEGRYFACPVPGQPLKGDTSRLRFCN